MSIEGIRAAFASPVASPTQKAVMVVLGNYADPDHESAPPIPAIMACTAFCERTVRTALRSLEADGMIVRRERVGDNGATLPAAYFLAFVVNPPPRVVPLPAREHLA